MSSAASTERVRECLAAVLEADLDGVGDGDTLADVEGLAYDSVTVVECVAAVEEVFGVTIDFVDDDVRFSFRSIANIVELVRRKQADIETLGEAP